MISHFTVSTAEVDLVVQDFGGADEQPVILFAHAAGLCAATWQPLAEQMVKDFRCFGVDLRAHGASVRLSSQDRFNWHGVAFDFPFLVASLRSRLQKTDVPIFGVGHSMGATTLLLAEIADPGLFTKIWSYEPIFFSSAPVLDMKRTAQLANGARKRKKRFASKQEAYERYKDKLPFSLFDERCVTQYIEYGFRERPDGTVELCCDPEDEAQFYETANSGITEIIKDLKTATLIAIGSDDGDRVPAIRKALEMTSPAIELREYPEASHFGPQQFPDTFAADISEWFRRF